MTVKGTNFRERKLRLARAFADESHRCYSARLRADWDEVKATRSRIRLLRLAWQRLDDHLYPNKRYQR